MIKFSKEKLMQKIIIDEAVKYPLVYQINVIAAKKQIKNISLFPMSSMFFSGDSDNGLIKVKWEE